MASSDSRARPVIEIEIDAKRTPSARAFVRRPLRHSVARNDEPTRAFPVDFFTGFTFVFHVYFVVDCNKVNR